MSAFTGINGVVVVVIVVIIIFAGTYVVFFFFLPSAIYRPLKIETLESLRR